ncbi:MAG: hypothetical protein B0A82_04500 [Alkalinema sp. CACIAM 70d]|nr:MAG: hypothetical protein B0A82_04500 [Alkalinema sp. CACIAM 70d]
MVSDCLNYLKTRVSTPDRLSAAIFITGVLTFCTVALISLYARPPQIQPSNRSGHQQHLDQRNHQRPDRPNPTPTPTP